MMKPLLWLSKPSLMAARSSQWAAWTAVVFQWAAWTSVAPPMGCVGLPSFRPMGCVEPPWSSNGLFRHQPMGCVEPPWSSAASDRQNPVGGDIRHCIASFRHPNLCTILQAAMRICYHRAYLLPCLRDDFFRYWAELRFM